MNIQQTPANVANYARGRNREIVLTRGAVAIIDEKDYEEVSKFKWCYDGRYASRGLYDRSTKKRSMQRLHTFLMNTPKGMNVDHINGNKLDNRRSNLRICSHNQNLWNYGKHRDNGTGYKGVILDKRYSRYQARIQVNKITYSSPWFDTPEEAHKAYKQLSKTHHGEYSNVR